MASDEKSHGMGATALRACAREEAADLRLPVGAHVRPDYGGPKLIRLGDHRIVRHNDPLAVQAHAIGAVLRTQSTSSSLKQSAKDQHSPLPPARRSNCAPAAPFDPAPRLRDSRELPEREMR